jgi:membrane protease YdiL (CAAX protease family)
LFEELFLTGYLLRALIRFGASIAIGVPVLVRALCHLYQGPLGTMSVIGAGVVLGAYYWRKRQLWPVVFAHIFADIAGFILR